MRPRRLLPFLVAAIWLPRAVAEPVIPPSERPGLGGAAVRQAVDATAAPWRSLGRVQTELGQRCTGSLVAPDRVLTAAHCLVAPRSGRWVQPDSVHFLLGYEAGRYRAHRRVVSFEAGPDYRPAERGPVGADWAILRLEAPLDAPALPLGPVAPGDPVMLGGYQQDRAEVLTADTGCQVLGMARAGGGAVLRHGCAGTRGASGGPLLRRDEGGGWSVVGVAVAAARGQAGGLAVPAAAIPPWR